MKMLQLEFEILVLDLMRVHYQESLIDSGVLILHVLAPEEAQDWDSLSLWKMLDFITVN
jgi:hypothetical protein